MGPGSKTSQVEEEKDTVEEDIEINSEEQLSQDK